MAFTPTLSKFGIPLVPGQTGMGILQPKIKYKFRVSFNNFAGLAPTLEMTRQIKTVTRPSISFNETAIHSYNNIMYIPQKPTWNTIEITLMDDVTSAASRLIQAQLQRQHNFFDQTSPLSGSNFKFQTSIETLDGGDVGVLEAFYLEGCYITTASFDSFDFSSSEPVQISMTVRFDNCQQETSIIANAIAGGLMAG